MAEITVAADLDSLNDVLAFVDGEMERAGCSMKLMTQVDMAVEEIFVNIARYAYHPEAGEASVRCEAGGDPFQIVVGFADRGRPFNPLDREDPDVTLDAEARQLGGLGILMAKKLMDDIQYEYRDGKNILTLRKNG
ncbi:MAG TPA: ATP-binding protein [Candidatus Pelethomonas intestinigallinarum]|nr:ATP-binding protein [Candidatus Pelethomonas intestinigallinarum]